MLNINTTNLDDAYLWFDIDHNKRHLKYDGEHYICDSYLFNRCKEQSLEIRELRADNERLQRKLKQHYEEAYHEGYDAGYNEATNHCFSGDCKQLRECLRDCKQLRECLHAILDRGETPEDSGSKADRG